MLVSDIMLAPQPAFEDLKKRLTEAWMAEQITELSERFINNLISRYEIIVEETEVPITIPGGTASQ